MMSFFSKLLSESGEASSKRFVLVCAGVSLSLAVIILSVAAVCGKNVSAELNAVATSLAGLGTFSYVGGRFADKGDASV